MPLGDLPLTAAFDAAPISSQTFQRSLERHLEQHSPALFVLDPLYAFHGADTNAANIFEEGALLSSLSGMCQAAGTTLLVVNHFNQTGTGKGLKRITQVGGGEWSDSWLLLTQREDFDSATGTFHLSLEIGSRQWGGAEYELELTTGRYD